MNPLTHSAPEAPVSTETVVSAPPPATERVDATAVGPASARHKLAMSVAVSAPLVGVVIAMVAAGAWGWFSTAHLIMMLVGWALTSLGITIGFHRLLAHRSFETHSWVRLFWTVMGALSVEGSPLIWCAVHRRHHQYSDRDGDPHSPHLARGSWAFLRGFWNAHVGWLFRGYWSHPEFERYIPDLISDPWLVRVDRLYYIFVLLSLAAPAAIGWWLQPSLQGVAMGLLWGGLVRIFLTHHITWSINSICHLFGTQDFVSNDHSRNNWLCGLLAFGEGWHNNHHAFPTSARHGLTWRQVDVSWWLIRGMQACGLAWNVQTPSSELLRKRREAAAA